MRLSSDPAVLGSLANSRGRAVILWAVTGGLLPLGLAGMAGEVLGPAG